MHGMLRSMVKGETKKRLTSRESPDQEASGVFLTLHAAQEPTIDDLRRSHRCWYQPCTHIRNRVACGVVGTGLARCRTSCAVQDFPARTGGRETGGLSRCVCLTENAAQLSYAGSSPRLISGGPVRQSRCDETTKTKRAR